MIDHDADRTAQRSRLLARIEHDREQLAGTLDELRRPLHSLQQLQKNARAIVPALFAAGAALLILRALRGSNRRPTATLIAAGQQAYPVIYAPRPRSWFALVIQMFSAYRSAVLVGETLRSVSHASPSRPAPAAATAHPTFEKNPT